VLHHGTVDSHVGCFDGFTSSLSRDEISGSGRTEVPDRSRAADPRCIAAARTQPYGVDRFDALSYFGAGVGLERRARRTSFQASATSQPSRRC